MLHSCLFISKSAFAFENKKIVRPHLYCEIEFGNTLFSNTLADGDGNFATFLEIIEYFFQVQKQKLYLMTQFDDCVMYITIIRTFLT